MDLEWFPFYTTKWMASGDIQQMDYFQKGFYLEMLIYQWHNDRIPADKKTFKKLFGLTARQYDKVLLTVCSKFVHETFMKRSYYVQKVLTEIKQTQLQKHHKRVDAGRKGGLVTSNATSKATSNALPIEENRIEENKDKEKNILKKESEINSETAPFEDPYYRGRPDHPDHSDVIELVNLVVTKYKTAEYSHEVQPVIQNLLGYFPREKLEKAILKAIEDANPNQQFRPNFKKLFNGPKAVEGILSHVKVKPMTDFEKAIAEREKKNGS